MDYGFKECQSVDDLRMKKQEALDSVNDALLLEKEKFLQRQEEERQAFLKAQEEELAEKTALIHSAYMEAYSIVGDRNTKYKRIPIEYISKTIPQPTEMSGIAVIVGEVPNDTIKIDSHFRVYI